MHQVVILTTKTFGQFGLPHLSKHVCHKLIKSQFYNIRCLLTELNSFLKTLDDRINVNEKESKRHSAERIKRVEGSLHHIVPPNGVPSWAIDKEWIKGKW